MENAPLASALRVFVARTASSGASAVGQMKMSLVVC